MLLRLLVRFAPSLAVRLPLRRTGIEPFAVTPRLELEPSFRRRGLHSLDSLLAASGFKHDPCLRLAIHGFKYRYDPLLHREFARMIVAAARDTGADQAGAVLCPVPLHWRKRHRRGYNQADLLARSVARAVELPVAPLLTRGRDSASQARRSRTERFSAVAHAFRLRHRRIPPAHVILVDDVSATGATLDACARVLKQAGAGRVDAWVVAHDPLWRTGSRPS